jgi:hypothetical protein
LTLPLRKLLCVGNPPRRPLREYKRRSRTSVFSLENSLFLEIVSLAGPAAASIANAIADATGSAAQLAVDAETDQGHDRRTGDNVSTNLPLLNSPSCMRGF